MLTRLQDTLPAFVTLLIEHRPAALRGKTLRQVLRVTERQPARLTSLYHLWCRLPELMYRAAPSLVFAVIGQARSDGRLNPEDEAVLLGKLLTHWALASTLDTSSACAVAATAPTLRQRPAPIRATSYISMGLSPAIPHCRSTLLVHRHTLDRAL